MAAIRISNFGGIMPRMLPQALPANAAVLNQNLLCTSTEFRPVSTPEVVAVGAANAITLYRNPHNSDGSLNTTPGMGWYSDARDLNAARGQLVDDATDRLYFSYNDGGAPPSVTAYDLTAAKPLGVPAPSKAPVCSVITAKLFRQDDANTWLSATLIPAVQAALLASLDETLPNARFTGNASTAGVHSSALSLSSVQQFPGYPTSRRGVNEPWNLMLVIPKGPVNSGSDSIVGALAAGFDDAQLGGLPDLQDGNNLVLGIAAFPFWGLVDKVKLKTALGLIKNPRSGTVMWAGAALDKKVADLAALFDPTTTDVQALRNELDAALNEFWQQGYRALRPSATAGRPPYPTNLLTTATSSDGVVVSVGNYDANRTFVPSPAPANVGTFKPSGADGNYEATDTPQYAVWKAATDKNQVTLDAYNNSVATWKSSTGAANVAAMVAAQQRATAALGAIEAMYGDAKTNLADTLNGFFLDMGLQQSDANPGGLVIVDGDPIVETRFYVATWVTDWGEESAPGPVSDMIELNQAADAVLIKQPALEWTDRHITKWRIYRSNTGSSGAAAFQFVAELALNATVRAPVTSTDGRTGWLNTDTWLDVVGTWQTYSKIDGVAQQYAAVLQNTAYIDPRHLSVGDTVTLASNTSGYVMKKTWSGRAWTDTPVTTSGVIGATGYVDGLIGEQLGEVCTTATWLPPPFRTKDGKLPSGANPYLRGLVGMPGGFMAGFIDNYVAFCDPYHPYAWPVEYQTAIKYPIVGLGVFGNTLFVGTPANPYLISGSDSANMTAHELDASQACSSRRSIVSAGGGVFYASPDGLCFASQAGVAVATQHLFSHEDWQVLNPESMVSANYDGLIYIWFRYRAGYTGGRPEDGGVGCIAFDPGTGKLVQHTLPMTAVYEDLLTDSVYGVWNGQVHRLFSPNTIRATAFWKSGVITFERQEALAWIQVWGNQSTTYPATVKWWVRDVPTDAAPNPVWTVAYTATVTDTRPRRLPPGRYLEHQIEVISQARISSVTLAGSQEELQAVQ